MAAQQSRPSTLAMYDSHVRNRTVPMLGRRPMALRRTDISAFVVDLTHKQLATATVVTIYRVLAMILRSAVHDRLLAVSPYKIELPGMPPRRLQALTAEQVGDLLEHAPPRDYAVLALGVGTGMRQGEVLGLTLPHLRLLAREVSVEQQCRVVPGGPPQITEELKTAASRRVLRSPVRRHRPGPADRAVRSRPCADAVLLPARLWRRGSFNEPVWKLALLGAGCRASTASTRCATPTPRR